MKKAFYILATFYLITLLLICKVGSAQNLVPNGDFETVKGCSGPNGYGTPDVIDSAANWLNPTLATPDFFNPCTTSSPSSQMGYQVAHSGVGYAGMYIWMGQTTGLPDYREYISVPLTATLVAGSQYHFEMYVNLASRYYHVTTSSIGALFTPSYVSMATQNNLPGIPQVLNTTGFIIDTTNWVLVQGNFIADGGERFLTIGNFRDYITSDSLMLLSGATGDYYTYTYIDDVSLTRISTGIENINNDEDANLFPNPATDHITVQTANNEQNTITLFDITGRKLYAENYSTSISIDVADFTKGIYLYEIGNEKGLVKKGKFIK